MYKIFYLKTGKASKRSWKTFLGAYGNIEKDSVVLPMVAIEWIKKHPEWVKEQLQNENNRNKTP